MESNIFCTKKVYSSICRLSENSCQETTNLFQTFTELDDTKNQAEEIQAVRVNEKPFTRLRTEPVFFLPLALPKLCQPRKYWRFSAILLRLSNPQASR